MMVISSISFRFSYLASSSIKALSFERDSMLNLSSSISYSCPLSSKTSFCVFSNSFSILARLSFSAWRELISSSLSLTSSLISVGSAFSLNLREFSSMVFILRALSMEAVLETWAPRTAISDSSLWIC